MATEPNRHVRRTHSRHRKTRRAGRAQATYPAFSMADHNLFPSATAFEGTSATYARYIGRVGAWQSHSVSVRPWRPVQDWDSAWRVPTIPHRPIPPTPTTPDTTSDVDTTSMQPPTEPVTPVPANDVRTALTRIANVPKMIFNATGGAHTSGDDNKHPTAARTADRDRGPEGVRGSRAFRTHRRQRNRL